MSHLHPPARCTPHAAHPATPAHSSRVVRARLARSASAGLFRVTSTPLSRAAASVQFAQSRGKDCCAVPNRRGLNAYLHRFHLTASPDCDLCHVPETIPHFLLSCPRYRRLRPTSPPTGNRPYFPPPPSLRHIVSFIHPSVATGDETAHVMLCATARWPSPSWRRCSRPCPCSKSG
ncbi:hypothetical protein C8R43DRAFT_893733 [Mycena crocata]|nr:hypothetical protein C8R43DRAFT_893733 [Mycena crocata]